MARSRNIKPGFFTNDILGELPALTRLLFAGMWTIADREGRIEDRPKKIRAEVLPYDQCDAEAMLAELEKAGFIKRYAACGVNVIQVVAWDKHQNPHVKESVSTLPAPDQHQTSTVLGTTLTGASRADSLLLIPDSLNKDTSVPDSDVAQKIPAAKQDPIGFSEFWETWPSGDRKQAKGKCLEAWKKARFETVAALVKAHVESLKVSASWTKNGGEFIPAPLVYLNKRSWEGADISEPASERFV